jgi:hypothetical protein
MLNEIGKSQWYFKPVVVIFLLFFILGPFGLPLLYKSPHFGKTSKILLTIAVLIYTAYLVYATIQITRQLLRTMEELQGLSP